MLRLFAFLVFGFLGAPLVDAQAKAVETRTLRLLAVGDAPPFRQEIRDGIRYELPPPEGSVPPVRVELSASNGEGEEQESEYEANDPKNPGIGLKLNQISRRLTVPRAELRVRILAGNSEWHTCRLPEEGNFLLVLWKDPKIKSWSKARSILVPDGGSRFQSGDLRFINVSPAEVGFTVGEKEQFGLGRGKVLFKSLGFSQGTPTKAFYEDAKGASKRLWSGALVQKKGERSTVVVYLADGLKPRRPLKLISFRERAVALPK